MNKLILILFLLFSNLMNAQENQSLLINKTFIANIKSMCEETPEGYDCSSIEVYLTLNFAKESVSIIEKEISNCGTENITFKLDYKWELTENSEIKMVSKSKEVKYNFLKDLVLKIEDKKVIGYKRRRNKITDKIEFKQ